MHGPRTLSDDNAWELKGEPDNQHRYKCERCESLEGVLEKVAEMLDKGEKSEEKWSSLKSEYTESMRNI